jgi:glycine/D-amino acid oxidase-like deaminating enzyme
MVEMECDVLIVGGGTGGCAAAMAACSLGMRVILTEANNERGYDESKSNAVLGGQLTSQLVPPDEHPWIEEFGCTARYREFRNRVRQRAKSLMNGAAKLEPFLNPGGGWVSRLCYRIGLGEFALKSMLRAEAAHGKLDVIFGEPVSAATDGDSLTAVSLYNYLTAETISIHASCFLDATELGDMAPLAQVEYRVGSEGRGETGEPHATATAEPMNIQGFTWCFALQHDPDKNHVRDRPENYSFWRDYSPAGWPGPLFSFVFPDPITGNPR